MLHVSKFIQAFRSLTLYRSVLEFFGALLAIKESLEFFFPTSGWAAMVSPLWPAFLATGLINGLRRSWPQYYVESKIQGTDIFVRVEVGDLLEKSGVLLIGSSSTFDTSTDDGVISPNSVQGQYTKRFARINGELDRMISEALQHVEPAGKRTNDQKPYGKLEFYELGTIAPVCCSNRHAYFAAIAHFNAHKVARVTTQDLLDSFPKLWNQIRERGSFKPIFCPILGSGYSRVALSRQELVIEIVKSFVAACSEGKFTESLTIMVRPEDHNSGFLSLPDLGLFLAHTCRYAGKYGSSSGEVTLQN